MIPTLVREGSYLLKKAKINSVNTLYFGGGTPSLMSPQWIEVCIRYLVSILADHFKVF